MSRSERRESPWRSPLRPPFAENFSDSGSIPRAPLPMSLVMTTLPLTERPAMRTEPATDVGEFRPSAAFSLPRLRPVADFVALPSTKRYITIQGKFGLALLGAGLWLVFATLGSIAIAPALAAAVTWPIAVALLLAVVSVPGFFLAFSLLGIALDHPPAPSVAHPTIPVTVVVTARNQPRSVVST